VLYLRDEGNTQFSDYSSTEIWMMVRRSFSPSGSNHVREDRGSERRAQPQKWRFQFPSAVTTLAIVSILVWVAALFIPAGQYATDADGSPSRVLTSGSNRRSASASGSSSSSSRRSTGIYGLLSPERGTVDTQTVGRLFGQIGVIVFIMSIGAFISISFATHSLEVAVAALATACAAVGGC